MAERDRLQHGDLKIETVRNTDGCITIRIDPGTERVRVITYESGALVLARAPKEA